MYHVLMAISWYIVLITTANSTQQDSTWVLRKFRSCSRSVGGLQWLEIRLNALCLSALPQKLFQSFIVIRENNFTLILYTVLMFFFYQKYHKIFSIEIDMKTRKSLIQPNSMPFLGKIFVLSP